MTNVPQCFVSAQSRRRHVRVPLLNWRYITFEKWGKMLYGMKRLQIMIEEDVDAALGRQAAAEGVSKAALIRRYVGERLRQLPPLPDDPLWQIVGLAEGEPGDSLRVNEVVYGPLGRE